MATWDSGYVSDIGYTFGYYAELNPLRSSLALLNSGIAAPKIRTACELGYGQGISVNIHAAASDVKWFGTDFNPTQAGFAQSLNEASGSGAQLSDDGFSQFASREDLPDFDYIALHGIWSWVSDANRAVIVDFIRRKLKVGGVLYLSYNTMPGWASFVPLRFLMAEHAEIIASSGTDRVSKIEGALNFVSSMFECNPLFKAANPQVENRLKKMLDQDRHYLAHEFFNKDWQPMHFSSVANSLKSAKLEFAAHAHITDSIDAINLTSAQSDFLTQISNGSLRQTTRDFMTNQQFRRDYWIKGIRSYTALERYEALNDLEVMLCVPRKDIKLAIQGAKGEIELNTQIYTPILDLLADHKPRTLGAILRECQSEYSDLSFKAVCEAIMILSSTQVVAPVNSTSALENAKPNTDRLNNHLIRLARSQSQIGHLASPVTGGGIPIGRIQLLFLDGLSSGSQSSADLAAHAWSILSFQGEKMLKDGKAIESEEDNLDDLQQRAAQFIEDWLPILKALHIA